MRRRSEKKRTRIVGLSFLLLLFILIPFYPTSAYLSDRVEQKLGISISLGNLREDILNPSTGTYVDELLHIGELRPAQNQKTITFSSILKNTGSLDSNHAFKIDAVKPANLSEPNFVNEKKNITTRVEIDGKVIFQGKLSELTLGHYSVIELDSMEPQDEYILETTLTYEGKQNSVKSYDLEFIVTAMAIQTNKTDISPDAMFYDNSIIRNRVSVSLRKGGDEYGYFSNDGYFSYQLDNLDMYFGKDFNNQTATLNYGRVGIYVPEGIDFADLRFTSSLGENGSRLVQESEVNLDETTRIATVRYRVINDGNQSAWVFDGQIIIEKIGQFIPGQYGELDRIPFNGQNGRKGVARKLYLNTDGIVPGSGSFLTIVESDILLNKDVTYNIMMGFDDRTNVGTNAKFTRYPLTSENISARLRGGAGSDFKITQTYPFTISQSNNGKSSDLMEIQFTGDTDQKILLVRNVKNNK